VSGEDVLQEARRLVAGDRCLTYGTPVESMRRVAEWWTLADGQPHTGREVALPLALVKLAREHHRHGRDNLVDAAGYLLIASLCADAEQGAA